MAKDLKPKKPGSWEARKLKAAEQPQTPNRRPVFGKRSVPILDRSPSKR